MHLFEPLKLRDVTFRNRIFVSPMCQYSSNDGHPTPWHLVHLGSRAVGGAALVIVEATAVEARGRISPDDSGIWSEDHVASFAPITRFIVDEGAAPGIQLAHAGRKASTYAPWKGSGAVAAKDGGWTPIAPSALKFDDSYPEPAAMTDADIDGVVTAFAESAKRAIDAGFTVLEIHAAHGYLLHEFLSPLSNQRSDSYGGSLENRMRLPLRVIRAVRKAIPDGTPLFLRISATDWVAGGWDVEQSCAFAKEAKKEGVDLIDVSSGGNVPKASIPMGPGYQTAFAANVRSSAGIPTGAVGGITSPEQADHVLRSGQADAVLLARELLRDPYWPRRAAHALGQKITAPKQYGRAW